MSAYISQAGTVAARPEIRLDRPDFYLGDCDAALAWMRREAPVYWHEPGEFWVVSRHGDVKFAASAADLFTTRYGFEIGSHLAARHLAETHGLASEDDPSVPLADRSLPRLRREAMLAYSADPEAETLQSLEPPAHTDVRKIVSAAFAPRKLRTLSGWIHRLTTEALDSIEAGEVIDLVDALAVPVPVYVIAELLGVSPQDRADFKRWTDVVIQLVEPKDEPGRAHEAEQMAQLYGYFRAQIADRRVHPRDDLLTDMVNARVGGQALSSAMIETLAMQLLAAGNETTRSAISGAALALYEHPAQRARLLADPGMIETAVDEFLRWVTPTTRFARTATRTTEIAGTPIAAGDFVVLSYRSANRDEQTWPHADQFDVTRAPSPMHLAFSHGIHICLGQALARMELRTVFTEFLTRFPDYELAGQPEWIHSTMNNTLAQLPVRFR